MINYDYLLENSDIDLLDIIEFSDSDHEIDLNNIISESDMIISLYETQQFIVEQNTHIFSYLNYEFISEGVIDNLKAAIEKIIDKIKSLIRKIIGYIKAKRIKINSNNFNDIKKAYDIIKSNKEFYEKEFLHGLIDNNYIKLCDILYSEKLVEYIENTKLSVIQASLIDEVNKILNHCNEMVEYCTSNQDISNNDEELLNTFFNSNQQIRFYTDIANSLSSDGITTENVKKYFISIGFPKFVFSYFNDGKYDKTLSSAFINYRRSISAEYTKKVFMKPKIDRYFTIDNTYKKCTDNYDLSNNNVLKDLDSKIDKVINGNGIENVKNIYFSNQIYKLYLLASYIIMNFDYTLMEYSRIIESADNLNKYVLNSFEKFKLAYNIKDK